MPAIELSRELRTCYPQLVARPRPQRAMSTFTSQLEQLARETQKSEAEVTALALETGVRQLWRERTLGRLLRGEISRAEAVESVGVHWVDLAERQHRAVREDLEWAKGRTP